MMVLSRDVRATEGSKMTAFFLFKVLVVTGALASGSAWAAEIVNFARGV